MGEIELRAANGEPAIYIAELSADNLRLGKLNEMLREANILLSAENRELKKQVQNLMHSDGKNLCICKDCGKEFAAKAAMYCPTCRRKRLREAARKNGLNRMGNEARRKEVRHDT